MGYRTSAKQHRQGTVTRTPAKTTAGYETSKDLLARLQREEQEAAAPAKEVAEKPQRDAELAKAASIAASRQLKRETLLTEQSELLADRCEGFKSEMTATTSAEYSEQMLSAIRKGLTGVTFGDEAKTLLMQVASLNRMSVNLTDPRVWKTLFDVLVEHQILSPDGSVASTEQPVASSSPVASPQATKSEPNLDELLRTTSAESRSGQKILHEAVRKEVSKDNYAAWDEFAADVQTLFFDSLTTDEGEALLKIMNARNLNKNNPRDWHKARQIAVRAGYLRPHFLTPDEQLAIDVETGKIPTNTFEEKRAFARRVAEIHGRIPVLG
jgi:hypothetical protein